MGCSFWTKNLDGEDGKSIGPGRFTLEQFNKCLKCRHFGTSFDDYQCNKPGGKDCLVELVDLFEAKE